MNVLALTLFVYVLTKAGMGNIWVFYFFYITAFFADCFLVGKFIVCKYGREEEEEEEFDFFPTPPKTKRDPSQKNKKRLMVFLSSRKEETPLAVVRKAYEYTFLIGNRSIIHLKIKNPTNG